MQIDYLGLDEISSTLVRVSPHVAVYFARPLAHLTGQIFKFLITALVEFTCFRLRIRFFSFLRLFSALGVSQSHQLAVSHV